MVETKRVLELINQVRATYDAPQLASLLPGQLRSASFCPVGRSLRAGVEKWLFVAVGTKLLRVWALERDPVVVGNEILKAWGLAQRLLKKSGEKSGYVLLPLPSELRAFVHEFDGGLWPDYQCNVHPQEVFRLRELAHGMPIPGKQPRPVWLDARVVGSQPSNLPSNLNP